MVDLAAEASSARHAGDASTAMAKASEGLRLFRGEVLIDLGDWAEPHRARLEELRLGLLEDVMAARVDLGAGGELVGELETLVTQHPLRERLWASLMTALYRGGRQADALATYARVRRLLVDELGVEPGPDLRALEQQVLRQSPSLGGPPDLHRVAIPATCRRLTPLLGRGAELVALSGLVDEHRFVSVVGPAGVGKTRLLLELARGARVPVVSGWCVSKPSPARLTWSRSSPRPCTSPAVRSCASGSRARRPSCSSTTVSTSSPARPPWSARSSRRPRPSCPRDQPGAVRHRGGAGAPP